MLTFNDTQPEEKEEEEEEEEEKVNWRKAKRRSGLCV